jgi:hypothetical protein
MDLLVDVFSSWANPSPIRDGILLPLVRLVIKARNHTHNVLPISLAFSWQDLLEKSPGPCLPSPQGLSIALGDGTRLRTTCSQTHTHFSFYTGWNPKGDGEEIWDDFFAYGELGCQHDVSFASILCLQSLVAPQAEILAQFYLLNEPDLHEL